MILERVREIATLFDQYDGSTENTMLSIGISDRWIDIDCFQGNTLKSNFKCTYDREDAKFQTIKIPATSEQD